MEIRIKKTNVTDVLFRINLMSFIDILSLAVCINNY